MFGNEKVDHTRPTEDFVVSLGKEQFFNVTDKKIYKTKANREFLKQKLLFDINLEKRRLRLRQLLEEDEDKLTEEQLGNIDSVYARKRKLIEEAVAVRNQSEMLRRDMVEKKLLDLARLKDDSYRKIQSKLHIKELAKDWEKLEKMKEESKREEECETKFWLSKNQERDDDMQIRLDKEKEKREKIKEMYRQQFFESEEKKKKLKEEQEKERKTDYWGKLAQSMAEEKHEDHMKKINKQNKYRKCLDGQIRYKNNLNDKDKALENAANSAPLWREVDHITINHVKTMNNLKHAKDMIRFKQCMEKERLREDEMKSELSKKCQKQLEKDRKFYDYIKVKKYKDLVADIKSKQKDQLIEHEERKKKIIAESLIEREKYQKQCEAELEKEKDKIKAEKEKIQAYFKDLKGQIVHNNKLREFHNEEKKEELMKNQKAEEEYLRIADKLRKEDKLLHIHPYRLK